ncbi:MAG: MATE family efflux transporter [Metamycoplasmataceae bacterium]
MISTNKIEKHFGNKKFLKTLAKTFFPSAIQAFFSIAVIYVDNFSLAILLKQDGEIAKTALGLANPFITLLIIVITGWLGGTSIMMSQYFGSKEFSKTRQITFYRIWSGMLIALPMVVLFMTIPEQFILFASGDISGSNSGEVKKLINYASIYLFWSAWTFFPYIIATGLSFSMQETRRANVSLYAAIAGILINIILNPIFIFIFQDSPELSIIFVAISTGIARIIQIIYLLVYLFLKKNDPVNFFKNLKIEKEVFKKTNMTSYSIFLNDLFFGVTNMFLILSLLRYSAGTPEEVINVSVMTNVTLVLQFTEVIWPGMASSSAVLIGVYLGRGDIVRAKDNCKKLLNWGFIVSIFVCLVIGIMSFWVNGILSPLPINPSPEIIADNKKIILLSMLGQLIMLIIILSQGMFSVLYYSIRSGGTRIIIISDAFISIIWCCVLSPLSFMGYLKHLNPIAILFIIESNQLPKLLFAYLIYKKINWAIKLTNPIKQKELKSISNEKIF